MSGDLNKKYIKNYVIRFINGKIDQAEATKIEKVLLNYSQEDWKKLLTVVKQLIKEEMDKFSSLAELTFSEEQKVYKDDALNLLKSGLNLLFAVFNEKVFYKCMQLEKQGNLTPEQKLTKSLLIIFPEIKKITSQSPKVANYHDFEESLTKKYNKLKADKFWKKPEMPQPGELEKFRRTKLEFIEIVQGFSPEEIIILKKKAKVPIISYVKESLATQMPQMFKKFVGSEQVIKTVLDVVDAIADEKSIKKFFDLVAKGGREFVNDPEKYQRLDHFEIIKKMGLEEELKGLMKSLTNNFNNLADKVSRYEEISSTESERMLEQLSEDIRHEVGDNTPPPVPAEQSFGGVLTAVGKIFEAVSDSDKNEFLKSLDNTLGNTQSKVKWYKDPVKISLLTVSIVVVSGLIGWLFFRKKNNRANYD